MTINTRMLKAYIIMLEAYKDYIEDNLDRTARDGWTPVCFEEFKASSESEQAWERLAGHLNNTDTTKESQ